jgi:hypothetical protein
LIPDAASKSWLDGEICFRRECFKRRDRCASLVQRALAAGRSSQFFSNGLAYIRAFRHAAAVVHHFRDPQGIDAVGFQPLRQREQIWIADGIVLARMT